MHSIKRCGQGTSEIVKVMMIPGNWPSLIFRQPFVAIGPYVSIDVRNVFLQGVGVKSHDHVESAAIIW